MDATITVGTNQVPLDVSFSELWEKMKFAASGHYEGLAPFFISGLS